MKNCNYLLLLINLLLCCFGVVCRCGNEDEEDADKDEDEDYANGWLARTCSKKHILNLTYTLEVLSHTAPHTQIANENNKQNAHLKSMSDEKEEEAE